MDLFISLEHFHAEERKYHIYKLSQSTIAENEHYHDYYQLCYVAKGEVRHRQGSKEVCLIQGDAFLIPPGFRHSVSLIRENSELYSLSFHPSLFHPGFPKSNVYKFLTAISLDCAEDKALSVQLRVVLNEAQQIMVQSLLKCLLLEEENDPPAELSAAASIIAATLCVLSQAYLIESENRARYTTASVYSHDMDKCIKYINDNLASDISVPELIKMCAMSKTAFYQLFLQATGMPVKKYVNLLRIEKAKSLIRSSDLSLTEIAHAVGFDNSSTFYRNFIQETGISPTSYRNAAL